MYSFFVLYSLGLCERLEQKMQPWSTEATHQHKQRWLRGNELHSTARYGGNPAGPWPAPAGSDQEDPLDTCLGHFAWPWDDGKFSNLNSWKTLLGPNPQNGVIRKFPAMTPPFPRDSRPAVCHATACVPPSCHEARPPWGETRDGDLSPPFPGGVESGIRPFSKRHSCGGEMCCFYQKKRRFKTSDTMNGRGIKKQQETLNKSNPCSSISFNNIATLMTWLIWVPSSLGNASASSSIFWNG